MSAHSPTSRGGGGGGGGSVSSPSHAASASASVSLSPSASAKKKVPHSGANSSIASATTTTTATPAAVTGADYVAEYDFFSNLKKDHMERLTREKRAADSARRAKLLREQFRWRDDGQQRFQLVEKKVGDLRVILKPHQYFRETMAALMDCCAAAKELMQRVPFAPLHRSLAVTILQVILQQHERRRRVFKLKVNLVAWKMVVMRELRNRFRRQHSWSENDYEKQPDELKIIRTLFRAFMNYVSIDKELRETLRKLRFKFNKALQKLNTIHKTQKACEFIGECKSFQHFNPKGCSSCGVIYFGGSLDGAVPYVKSVSRDTGVATLVTLDFEMDTLMKEEEIQVVIVDQLREELTDFEENSVYIFVRSAIQNWWAFVLMFKRLRKNVNSRIRSIYYYRIRRLSVMRKEIDRLIIEPQSIDMNYCCDKYCDYVPELLEYVLLQQQRKDDRILKYMRLFHRTLVEVVEEARKRVHEEMLRILSIPKPEPPMRIKALRPLSPKKLVCLREECKLRAFLTLDRFETHMAVHRKDDLIRYSKYENARKQKVVKDQHEQFMRANIQKSKQYVEEYLSKEEEGSVFCLPVVDGTSTGDKQQINELDLTKMKLSWSSLPHRYNMYGLMNGSTFTLELVSKHSSVDAASTVTLDNAITRAGTHESCELKIGLSGESEKLGKISKIHCLIYHGIANIGHENDTQEVHEERKRSLETLTIVDNSSVYGCYIVGRDGARKVPNKVSKGLTIYNGNLVCIGVCKDGPAVLPVTEASLACIVYRLQIHAT